MVKDIAVDWSSLIPYQLLAVKESFKYLSEDLYIARYIILLRTTDINSIHTVMFGQKNIMVLA